MAKVYFRYGTMRSGKSLDLLKVAHNYEEQGRDILILTPAMNTRDPFGTVSSRAGLEHSALIVYPDTDIYSEVCDVHLERHLSCVLVDEAQFFTKSHVLDLCRLADERNIPVIAYGLKSDFKGNLFEGSESFLIYADKIEEIKTVCWCGAKATFNARISNGKVITEGDQIMVGDEEYIPLCRKHYLMKQLPESTSQEEVR